MLSLYVAGVSVVWAIVVPAGTWDEQIGDFNDITPIQSSTDSRIKKYQSGRLGVAFFLSGLLLIKWAVSLLVPLKQSRGFSYESDMKRQEAMKELPRKQGPVLASAIVSMFIVWIYDAFGSYPIFTEYGEVWIGVFMLVSYGCSLVLYIFLQDDLYILPSKLVLKVSLYVMLLNSQRLSLVMFCSSIIAFQRIISQIVLVRVHKYYILEVIIKRYERNLPFRSIDDKEIQVTDMLREAADNSLHILVAWLSATYALFAYILYDNFSYSLYRSHMLYCFYFLVIVAVLESLIHWLLSWSRQITGRNVPLASTIQAVYRQYQARGTNWALCSEMGESEEVRPLKRGQELAISGLSSQLFVTLTVFALGVLSCTLGVKLFRSWPVNPFLDYWMFIVGLLSAVVTIIIKSIAVVAVTKGLWKFRKNTPFFDRGVDGNVITNPTDHIKNEVMKLTDMFPARSLHRTFQVASTAEDILSIASNSATVEEKINQLVSLFEEMELIALLNSEQCFSDLAKELDVSNPEQVKEKLKELQVPEHKVQLLSAHRAKLDIQFPAFPLELTYPWSDDSPVFPAISMHQEMTASDRFMYTEGKSGISSRENSALL